ncbi:hypothetical protein [Motilimonas cestriensis]|uniref:hypothetical protein n=1 Tax=Motilimonas cestriensis TaxID=2742685 RepID=UPI003DA51D1D
MKVFRQLIMLLMAIISFHSLAVSHCENLAEHQSKFNNVKTSADLLSLLYTSIKSEKILYIDQKYFSCLGCTNIAFGSFMYENFEQNPNVQSATLLYTEGAMSPELGKASLRKPYNRIVPTDAYMLLNLLVQGKQQKLNKGYLVETYPIQVTLEYRDCLEQGSNEQQAYCAGQKKLRTDIGFEENQAERVFTRHHFPNLLFIDSSKISLPHLEQLCRLVDDGGLELSNDLEAGLYRASSHFLPKDELSSIFTSVFDNSSSILIQLLNYNLYRSGSETAEDLNVQDTKGTLEVLLDVYDQDKTSNIDIFVRDGYQSTALSR